MIDIIILTNMSRLNFLVCYTGDKNEELNYDVSRIFNYNGIKFKEKKMMQKF